MLVAGYVAGMTLEEVGKVALTGVIAGGAAYLTCKAIDYLCSDEFADDSSSDIKIGELRVSREVWNTPEGRRAILDQLEYEYS